MVAKSMNKMADDLTALLHNKPIRMSFSIAVNEITVDTYIAQLCHSLYGRTVDEHLMN